MSPVFTCAKYLHREIFCSEILRGETFGNEVTKTTSIRLAEVVSDIFYFSDTFVI